MCFMTENLIFVCFTSPSGLKLTKICVVFEFSTICFKAYFNTLKFYGSRWGPKLILLCNQWLLVTGAELSLIRSIPGYKDVTTAGCAIVQILALILHHKISQEQSAPFVCLNTTDHHKHGRQKNDRYICSIDAIRKDLHDYGLFYINCYICSCLTKSSQ